LIFRQLDPNRRRRKQAALKRTPRNFEGIQSAARLIFFKSPLSSYRADDCWQGISFHDRSFAKIKNAYAARIVIFTNWAFGGLNAQFAKVQSRFRFRPVFGCESRPLVHNSPEGADPGERGAWLVKALIFLRHDAVPLPGPDPDFLPRARRLAPGFEWAECGGEAEFLARLPDAEIVLAWRFEADWLRRARRLRWIATPAAGGEFIRVPPGNGPLVTHGAFHGALMSETVLALLLAFLRGVKAGLDLMRDNPWPREQLTGMLLPLSGSAAGILGFGNIGKWIGRRLKAFDVRIVGVNRRDLARPDYFDAGDEVVPAAGLDVVLPAVDHLILALPSGTATDRIMDARRIALLKPGALFINVGRGNAVDEAALAEALRSGGLRGAGLDVFGEEPLPAASPLRNCPNIILLPHVSAMAPNYLRLFLEEFAVLARKHFPGECGPDD
jgi:phosphoglycerate dehydrogenase-like enzyme